MANWRMAGHSGQDEVAVDLAEGALLAPYPEVHQEDSCLDGDPCHGEASCHRAERVHLVHEGTCLQVLHEETEHQAP